MEKSEEEKYIKKLFTLNIVKFLISLDFFKFSDKFLINFMKRIY